MFGYVRICKEAMQDKDYEIFRAYYCGLCKAIGKYSITARLGLSYDMTFLFVLLSAVYGNADKKSCKCMLHPLKKEYKIESDKILEYVSGISILLLFRKLEDDVKDEKSIKAACACLACLNGFKKARKKLSDKDTVIKACINRISELERKKCNEIDEIADVFAKICESIFVPDFITDTNTKKILSWIGYNTGRWIYIMDAYDDLECDIKKKRYNPLAERIKKGETFEAVAENLDITLTYTMGNIAAAYDLLKTERNDNILKNIIYAGMSGIQAKVLKMQEEDNGSL